MLSPAIQTAAAQFANSQLGKPAMPAIALAYETGYHAGFIARPQPARFPLSGQREFLRVLAPYLAEDIDIYHPATGRYGKLKGLPATYEGQGEPLADVEFYADAEAREEGGGDLLEPYGKILPVLYSFEDLDKWVTNARGKYELVMEELIGCLYAGPVDIFKTSYHSSTSVTGKLLEWWVIDFATHEGTGCEATFRSDGAGEIESRPVNAAPLLQQYHFAVGLRPEQYKRKVAAASPCAAGCEGCEKGKEVGRG